MNFIMIRNQHLSGSCNWIKHLPDDEYMEDLMWLKDKIEFPRPVRFGKSRYEENNPNTIKGTHQN